MTNPFETAFTRQVGIQYPIICGAMYPCSNPELVAAASAAGAIGIVQPMSLTYAHGYDLREGLRIIRGLTQKPIGFNAIVEESVRAYKERMARWIDIALEEGVRFFITALGKPDWVVKLVEAQGGVVYHDVTERKWALKALDSGVHGLICVNRRAGGHAGERTPEQLLEELADLGAPLICAGGIGGEADFVRALDLGYAGVQMGTRFIASVECNAHEDYKQAILAADEEDIVLTDKLSGVPCAIIKTPHVERVGTKAGPFARWLLRGRHTKKLMRGIYTLLSLRQLKRASREGMSFKDYWAAGKSVADIHKVETCEEIIDRFVEALAQRKQGTGSGLKAVAGQADYRF